MASADQMMEVRKQMEFDRVKEWNEHGINGDDTPVIIAESSTKHMRGSVQRMNEMGSCKNIIWASITGSSKALDYGFMYNGEKIPAEKFIAETGVKVITRSISGPAERGTEQSLFWNEIFEKYNVYPVNSGGNDDEDPYVNSAFPLDVATQCSARNRKGYLTYSSEGKRDDDIDFCEMVGYQNGTSFAGPGHAQKARMVKSRYGKDMCYDEVFQFFVMCADKSGLPDNPKLIGYGTPRLPQWPKKYMQMDIGSNKFFINGFEEEIDVPPVINEMTTFVPIRIVSEVLGAVVGWDATNKMITISKGSALVKMAIGSTSIWVNGLKQMIEYPPYILTGRTMVPLKVVAVALGCKVMWVSKRKRVQILEV